MTPITFEELRTRCHEFMIKAYAAEELGGDPSAMMHMVLEDGTQSVAVLVGEVHECVKKALEVPLPSPVAMYCLAAPSFMTKIVDGKRDRFEVVIYSCESHTASDFYFARLTRNGKNELGALETDTEMAGAQRSGRLMHLLHQQTRN